jgi:hypothetical protein
MSEMHELTDKKSRRCVAGSLTLATSLMTSQRRLMRPSVPSPAVALVNLLSRGRSVRRRRSCHCKTDRGRWALIGRVRGAMETFPAAATLANRSV